MIWLFILVDELASNSMGSSCLIDFYPLELITSQLGPLHLVRNCFREP